MRQKKTFDSRTDSPSFDKTHWKQTKCLSLHLGPEIVKG
jgi:hypothetical protein